MCGSIQGESFAEVTYRYDQWRNQEFCLRGGGAQQIQLRTEDRENWDLGVVAPSQGF